MRHISEYLDHMEQKNEIREIGTLEGKIDFAWFKLKEAVDNKDVKQVRKMYHWIQWLEEKKQA